VRSSTQIIFKQFKVAEIYVAAVRDDFRQFSRLVASSGVVIRRSFRDRWCDDEAIFEVIDVILMLRLARRNILV
jgi:hypothetical protein